MVFVMGGKWLYSGSFKGFVQNRTQNSYVVLFYPGIMLVRIVPPENSTDTPTAWKGERIYVLSLN